MSDTIIFYYPENQPMAKVLAEKLKIPLGNAVFDHFPDGDSYVRLDTDVKDKEVILVCSLNNPDCKIIPILFFSQTAKELGAKKIGLVTPYLPYMRQDKRFKSGEAINADYFGPLISQYFDWMITVDPHLHRHKTLDEVYSIPTTVVQGAPVIAKWIPQHIKKPLLVGPDEESEQWVAHAAQEINAPHIVLRKIRHGHRDVEISVPQVDEYKDHTPVLMDDIISTARTMIETIKHLNNAGMKPTVCIGVHAVFAGDAYEALLQANIAQVVTCNTIPHHTNTIDMSESIAKAIQENVST